MKNDSRASPLKSADMVGFVGTTNSAGSREFYEGKLGFRVVSDDRLALMLDADGRTIRVQKLAQHTPQQFTVLGWNVRDIDVTVADLARAGVTCEQFGWPQFKQTETGICDFPDGTRVAWFKDPDGNILSVAQMPR